MAASTQVQFSRNIPVRHEVDVFIAGGGPSGVAAAVAARRQGASVFLAEGHSCFGGMGTAGLVPVYLHFGDGVNFLSGGVGEEIYNRLKQQTTKLYLHNPHGAVSIDAEVLKRIYDDMMVESGAGFTFYTHLIAVEAENGHVDHVICASKSGIFAVKARVFIDGTGDGDLAAWAGAAFEQGDEHGNLQPGSLCSTWTDIDWDQMAANPAQQDAFIKQAFADGVFSYQDLHLPGFFRTGKNVATGNLVHTFDLDATNEESITKALLWGRKGMLEYDKYYRKYFKGYENMSLVATGSLLGVRETRRITGDYSLNVHDFEQQSVFDDEIGRFAYPVDIHPYRPDEKLYAGFEKEFRVRLRYQPGESYGIPYRVLTPAGLDNTLVGGRCISCDRYIQGSIRVMSGCYITGQAAGIAAAIAADRGVSVHMIDSNDLQKRLKQMGGFLPNARS
jgi:hypothetical protein